MKRLLPLAVLILPAALHGADVGDLTWTVNDGEVTITDCSESASGSLDIPEFIERRPVTAIGDHAFSGCWWLSSITIPDRITSIGDSAFRGCWSLRSVSIGDGVTVIGDRAFHSCGLLESVSIGNGVTSIGKAAFLECFELTTLILPASLTTIGDEAFYRCGLTSIVLGDGVTRLGDKAFQKCQYLASVTLPAGLTSIGDLTFEFCHALTTITFPAGLTSIGRDAFRYCTSLESVSIPDGVKSIGTMAFSECSALRSIRIPASVTEIGSWAFEFCESLNSVEFLGGPPGSVGGQPFMAVASDAKAVVLPEHARAFGGEGTIWHGLLVEIDADAPRPPTITAFGFVDADTLFIEFEPGGTGYKVTRTSGLDFSSASDVTPTLEPTMEDNRRFEFEAAGPRDFFRVERN